MTALAYNVAEAAKQVGLGPDRIKRAIRAGELRAKTTGGIEEETGRARGRYLIKHADLEAWFDGLEDA